MVDYVKELNDRIDDYNDSMLKHLSVLVNMDSGSNYKKSVDALVDVLESWWREAGFSIKRIPFNEVGDCLLVTTEGDALPNSVTVLGHADTVYEDGTSERVPFRVEGKRAFGPGVADMKGGLVTSYFAAKALSEAGLLPMGLSFFINSHEEIGSRCVRSMIEELASRSSLVINMEPGRKDNAVVTGRKGVAWIHLRARGKAAHAGNNPEAGANAVVELAHMAIEINNINGIKEGLTANVDIFHGGMAVNVIPEEAFAEVDVRYLKEDDIKALDSYIKAMPGHFILGATHEFSAELLFPPMERTPKVLEAYELVRIVASMLQADVQEAFSGGGSDAGFAARMGVPVICGMGPVGGNFHNTQEEYIELATLTERCKLLAHVILKASEVYK
ncbi:MAG TPA: M20 family metallopeptidase [Thermosynergistes sp.]|nr:M20 family metallopeptidase [Thermosynergistes sp.]